MTAFTWNGSFPASPSTGDTLVMNDITYTRTSLGTWEVTGGVAITETGALNSGSITSGFGTIDNGASSITTTGALGAGATTVTTFTSTGIDDNATSTQLTISDSASTFAGDVTIDGETLLVNSPSTATDVAAIHFNGSTTGSARYANISKMYDSPYTMKMQASNSAGQAPLELWGSSDTMYLGFDTSGNATFANAVTATGVVNANNNIIVKGSTTSQGIIQFSTAAATYSIRAGADMGGMLNYIPTGGAYVWYINNVEQFRVTASSVTFVGTITGNGSGLTALNGSNISSGTIAAARVATLNQNTTGSAASFTGNLAGDVTGTQDATIVVRIDGKDDRDMKPNVTTYGGVSSFFTSLGGMTGTDDTDYQDALVLNTYGDGSGGDANCLIFDKSTKLIKHYLADQAATTWGTPETVAYVSSNITGSSGSCTGNSATVTNGVYTTGTQTIGGAKTFSDNATFAGDIVGTAVTLHSNEINATGNSGNIYTGYAKTQNLYFYTGGTTGVGTLALTLNASQDATFAGDVTIGNNLLIPDGTTPSFPVTKGTIFHTAANGLIMAGQGTSTDFLLGNAAGANVLSVPTGTTNAIFAGDVTATGGFTGNVTGNVTGSSGSCTGNAATATSADNIDGVAFTNTGSNSGINANTIASNGISYYNGFVDNFSGNATDGALYSQAHSSTWQHQIAGDYRSGQIALRGKNNNTWQAWRKVYDVSNDGSGSGLDADLLDGVDGSLYARKDGTDNLYINNAGPTVYFRDTDNNSAMLHCNSSIFYILRGGNNSTTWATTNGHWPFQIDLTNNNANFGGSVTAVGNITAYSDRKLKDNLEVIPNALAKVSALTGYTYDRIDVESVRQSGLIAQDVQKVLPEVVSTDVHSETKEETLTVAYGNMVGLLVEAIKELNTKIDDLQKQLESK
jgi:hypothetical protein